MESINKSPTTKSGSNTTAATQFLEAKNERYAYRRFGTGPAFPCCFSSTSQGRWTIGTRR